MARTAVFTLLGFFGLACALQRTLAADVTSSTGVLAYVIDSSCPPNWSDLSSDSTYKGRLIKGWNSNSNVGTVSGGAIGDNSIPSHNHPSWSRRFYVGDSQRTSCLGGANPRMLDDGSTWYMNQATSTMDARNTGIRRVTLRLCHYTSGITFNLPPQMVVYLHHSKTSCPAGFSDFGDAHGRFLVFGTSDKDLFSDITSPASPSTNSGEGIGYHTHYMPATNVQLRSVKAAHIYGCCGPTGAKWIEWRQLDAGQADSTHLNIPYVQLRSCISTLTTSTLGLPSSRMIFFYNGNSCPFRWREATARSDAPGGQSFSNIAGRMIFNTFDNNVAAGQRNDDGDVLYCAWGNSGCNGNGHQSHQHWYGSNNIVLSAQWSSCSWGWGATTWTEYQTYSWYFNTDNNAGSLFPYRVMRACSTLAETNTPTKLPTLTPTTGRPSSTPTTTFPTESPTLSPSKSAAPSKVPSRRPSRSPTTSKPSTTPTTSQPSTSPTTSKPSKIPSNAPSWNPTPSPVWKDVCAPEDDQYFVNYDNYVIQSGLCWSDCRVSILAERTQEAEKCIMNCKTLSLYTPLCRSCMMFWVMKQDEKCRGPCLANKFSKTCADCTNEFARQDFRECSGFEAADISFGGGDGGKDAPQPQGINAGLISGATLGAMLAFAGVVYVGRKIKDRQLMNADLARDMEKKIFGDEVQASAVPPSAPAGFKAASLVTLFKSRKSPDAKMINTSLVASEDDRASTDNPTYSHPSKNLSKDAMISTKVEGVYLRTRYSFHGKEADELDVPAGHTLKAIEKNNNWYVCQDETTGRYGLIPVAYVNPA